MFYKLALFVFCSSCFLQINAQYPDRRTSNEYDTKAVEEQLAQSYEYSPNEPPEKQLLNIMKPMILLTEYKNVRTEKSYSFSYTTDDGSTRTEEGIRINPDTPQEELVVMGSFGYKNGDIEMLTMYTADKGGYKPRVSIKNRKLNPKLLASLAG